jgi:hypothetical protein
MIGSDLGWFVLLSVWVGVGLWKSWMTLGIFNGTIEPRDEETKERYRKLRSDMEQLSSVLGPVGANAFLSVCLLLAAAVWPFFYIAKKVNALAGLFGGKKGNQEDTKNDEHN